MNSELLSQKFGLKIHSVDKSYAVYTVDYSGDYS